MPLSLWERAGVRVFHDADCPLTLTLSPKGGEGVGGGEGRWERLFGEARCENNPAKRLRTRKLHAEKHFLVSHLYHIEYNEWVELVTQAS